MREPNPPATGRPYRPNVPAKQAATYHSAAGRQVVWLLSILESDRYVWGFIPCFNGGRGEQALRWGGPIEYRGVPIEPPGRTETHRGWGRPLSGSLDYFRGLESGEEWIGTQFDHQVACRCQPTGSMEVWGPGSELVTSVSSGRRVLVRFESHLWVFPDGRLSMRSSNVVTEWSDL